MFPKSKHKLTIGILTCQNMTHIQPKNLAVFGQTTSSNEEAGSGLRTKFDVTNTCIYMRVLLNSAVCGFLKKPFPVVVLSLTQMDPLDPSVSV